MKLLSRLGIFTIPALILILSFSINHPALAVNINVACSEDALISAINTANANGEPDTLNLTAGCEYVLTAPNDFDAGHGDSGLKRIGSSITINGNGATIRRDSAASEFRLLHIAASGSLILNDTTIRGGTVSTHNGGGILVEGSLTLRNSTVTANRAFLGGGIYNLGTLDGIGSAVEDNTAGNGGGVASSGTLSLTDSTINDNAATIGGGLYIENGTATMTGSTISGNSAVISGGIFILNGETALLSSVVSGNSTGDVGAGGITNSGILTLLNSVVSGNTFSGDVPIGVGGVSSSSTVIIRNSIIWGNKMSDLIGQLHLSGTFTVSDSIVQGGFVGGTNIINANPLFVDPELFSSAPITAGDYHILPDSPALNAGNNTWLPLDTFDIDNDGDTAELLPIDRDGNPRIVNATVDLGAYEHQTLADVVVSKSSASVMEGGPTDSYSVRLASRPAADVIVEISTGGQTIADPATLTFTPSDWSVEQTVTITAIDDAVAEGDHNDTLTHAVSSTDAVYADFNAASVSVTITDDDAFPAEILANGGFEADLDLNGVPDGWKYKSKWLNVAPRDADKLVCKPAKVYAGLCAFRFRGSVGENARLIQVVDLTGITFTSGDQLTFSAYINGKKPAAMTRLIVSVTYTGNPTPVVTKMTVKRNAGYTLHVMPDYTLTSGEIDQIKVRFKHRSAAGSVFIDNASLIHTPVGGRRSDVPLPLPSAPSGFRGNN